MYILLALVGVLGYASQNIMLAGIYRRIDPLVAVAMRGLSLGITMLPILLLSHSAVEPAFLLEISLAAIFTFAANWSLATAYRYLSVGIAVSITTSLTTIFTALFDTFFFRSTLTMSSIIFMAMICGANVVLAAESRRGKADIDRPIFGAVLASGHALGLSFAIFYLTRVSRAYDPFMAAYAWEFGAGIICFLVAHFRHTVWQSESPFVSSRTFLWILVASSPTLVGSGCYAYAITNGSLAVITAVMSSNILVTSVLAWIVHKEALFPRQWAAVAVTFLALIGLQMW